MNEVADARLALLQEQSHKLLDSILSVAQPRAVWGEPVQAGDRTILTACEVAAGGGFGFGFGPARRTGIASTPQQGEASSQSAQPTGGGSGGGGRGTGRPVALVIIGPTGVEIRPVVDVTKIALAALTTWGAMLPILIGLRRANRRTRG